MPAAQEQHRAERGEHDRLDVLGIREHRIAQAAVLGVEAGDELGVGLGEVERRPVGLGQGRDEEHAEADRLGQDVPVVLLGVHDPAERQRAGLHDHSEDREREGDLVADELRDGAQAAEQRVLRARRPAGDEHAVEPHRPDRGHVQHAHVRVGDVQEDLPVGERDRGLGAERHQGERRDRAEECDERRGKEQARSRAVGDRVLLLQELAQVRDRLQEADRADPVRAETGLEAADHLALGHGHEREEEHQQVHEHERLDERDDDAVRHPRPRSCRGRSPTARRTERARRPHPARARGVRGRGLRCRRRVRRALGRPRCRGAGRRCG